MVLIPPVELLLTLFKLSHLMAFLDAAGLSKSQHDLYGRHKRQSMK